jgi:hypothetical protein
MMEKYDPLSIVYVDSDAEFMGEPTLFNELECEVALFELDRKVYYGQSGKEVCSGTIFLKNTESVYELLTQWEKECSLHPGQWDQRSLQNVIGDFHRLPPEYCTIDNTMDEIKFPIIKHHQASREVRKHCGKLLW